jgi:hypothetical protein
MTYLINVIDGTITDVSGAVILDTSRMDNETYAAFLEMNENELIELAKKIGIPVSL